ncbi:MAG: hypothetical protein KA109_07355 [Saprospiraceae bacterium]|nr:hypothetical protein [Saprospiraceae bacterium]
MSVNYNQRIDRFQSIINALTHQSQLIGRARLLTFVIGIALVIYLWNYTLFLAGGLPVIIVIFLFLVSKSKHIENSLILHKNLLLINQNEHAVLSGQYADRPAGDQYISKIPGQDNDLDIFGPGSLYQYINRSVSQQGSDKVAHMLGSLNNKTQILLRQEALKELSAKLDWRQLLMAIQMQHPVRQQTQDLLTDWIGQKDLSEELLLKKVFAVILSMLSITVTLAYAFHRISINRYTLFVLLMFGVIGFIAFRANKWFKHLDRISKELSTLLPCIEAIEQESFINPLLQDIAQKVKKPHSSAASIKKLRLILERYDYRLNPIVHIPLNFFTWWDLQNWIALIAWRKEFKGDIQHWFEALAEIEALNSFANLAHNHPDWAYPEIQDEWFVLEAKGLAHPLLPKSKAVVNDFTMKSPNQIDLITGSNMAGKSTFLRALGTNMILAGIGSPVNAQSFILSPGKVMTSMRISDNLQEETSTFYAELKKIKAILDAVKQKLQVIILIDEMLRGTNTEDRKLGSRGLIHQLIQSGAVGIIASHDTALSTFKDQFDEVVKNYYFDSYIDQDTLKFDYKIKEGVCTSANASFLMKKMGIDI